MQAESSCRVAIDQTYAAFVAELPPELRIGAERLPRRLGLVSRGDAEWSDVFDDVAILGMPNVLLGETDREVRKEIRGLAQRAHLFAMIAAAITVALDHGELEADDELDAIRAALERERNRALAELRLLGGDRRLGFTLPEREVRAALIDERNVFAGRAPASFARYLTISTAKQSLAFPATATAAVAAGFALRELASVHDLILGVMLGVQIRDDVESWLEEPTRGCAWVDALATAGTTRAAVAEHMLELACDAFNRAADAAMSLGAASLLRWSRTEANALRELHRIVERQLSAAPLVQRPAGVLDPVSLRAV